MHDNFERGGALMGGCDFMPQIQLEITSNIILNESSEILLGKINQLISSTCDISITNCKSRIITHQEHVIGYSNRERDFVHLRVELYKGRSSEVKKKLGDSLLNLIGNSISTPNQTNEPQITVYIAEIDPDHYFKK